MELNVPVFNLRLLKRHFYTFFIISVCFALVSILISLYTPVQVPETVAKAVKSWGNACWLVTHSRFLLYFILLQLILGLIFYPGRRVITKELKDMEIVFV